MVLNLVKTSCIIMEIVSREKSISTGRMFKAIKRGIKNKKISTFNTIQ